MSRDEIEAIVTTSLDKVGMTIENAGLHEISRIAIGLPHYAHLLGLHSGGGPLKTPRSAFRSHTLPRRQEEPLRKHR